MPRHEGLPGEYKSRFTVTAPIPSREGGSLAGHNTYVGTLRRLDKEWDLELQWVDLENGGHRIELPHEVVTAILRSVRSVLKRSRSDAGKLSAEKARAKGIIPFQRKDEPESDDPDQALDDDLAEAGA